MKFMIFALAVLSSSASYASETVSEADFAEMQNKNLLLNDVFLGCVSSRHECADEARQHGYHHSRAIRDHHTCHDHHAPLACYGIE